MKCCLPLLWAFMAITGIAGGQTLIDGTNYPDLFGGSDSVTVTAPSLPDGTLLGVHLGGSATGELGNHWNATATGGAVLGSNLPDILVTVPEERLAETGAQVALDGTSLLFNINNSPASILGSLGVGLSLALNWDATVTFDEPGEMLVLAPNTIYQVSFDVYGENGLLESTLGLAPSFGLQLLDGGSAVDAAAGGTLVNIIGLQLLGVVGSPPESGRAVVQFETGNTVSGNAAGLRFTGSALVPATALGIGTQFASVSNLSITQIPEPSSLLLGLLGAAVGFKRRR
ncbi:PEP-CTERM sorting domain-containing protein [Luteolibacter luteus]|uniref:PEP-CTERM protein-sorting domain-containing protein n=1 Tax=Luteolibacter luteus TaxID=2728835 RepID=A0A858RII3_9BACT|nr:PEP-CTERM sorting domain-containing protein [Luteolibacter luteus]QJE96652.1 hypothetical protein HHL09_12945 [Luteolibacter luteus]